MNLKSIEEEANDCRKAFEGVEAETVVWHCHHEQLLEPLIEPAEKRIDYILLSKSGNEQAIRLRLFRPVKNLPAYADWQKAYADWQKAYADWQKAYADWQKADADFFSKHEREIVALHEKECPDCPWNGRTIFP